MSEIEALKDKESSTTTRSVLDQMVDFNHEQVVFCNDKATGLKAIIAIHNTTLGPALGGTRMWNYNSEAEALKDVLRLSRGMTYKAAISGLNLGGGKAVIIGDSRKDKSEALFRRFGKFVDSLGGKYITAEDVGITTKEMEYVHMETDHVTGIPESMGGSGDPSPITAHGVYMGMKACVKERYGNDSLKGKKIAIQGVGHVGEYLIEYVSKEGAKVYINDIDEEKLAYVAKKYGAEVVMGDAIYDVDMDIYAPCALGATINDNTLPRLKCSIIAGSANNQFEDEDIHGKIVKEKGIIYAPDFLINAGGLINVNSEVEGYSRDKGFEMASEIYTTTLNIIKKAKEEDIPTYLAANKLAEERIAAVGKLKLSF